MPVTRSSRRTATRTNTKRTILSALDENKPATTEELKLHSNSSYSSSFNHDLPDLNVLQPESIKVILSDIHNQIKAKQESLSIRGVEIAKNQQEEFFVGTMKLDKKIKKMTIREFNEKYMNQTNSDCDSSSDKCIIESLKAIMIQPSSQTDASSITSSSTAHMIKGNLKRGATAMYLETPVRQLKPGKAYRTPGTILRTVQKGEAIYSANGSPVQDTEEGDLIATVSKKRRVKGDGDEDEDADAMFGINIDGRTISLSDKSTMEHLTNAMKNTAKNQLNVLQDQLSKLLSHLDSS